MSLLEHGPARLTADCPAALFKPLPTDLPPYAQGLYCSSLMQVVMREIELPKADRSLLVARAMARAMIVDAWWPGFVAVPLEGLALSSYSQAYLNDKASEGLYRTQGNLVTYVTTDLFFIGQLMDHYENN